MGKPEGGGLGREVRVTAWRTSTIQTSDPSQCAGVELLSGVEWPFSALS